MLFGGVGHTALHRVLPKPEDRVALGGWDDDNQVRFLPDLDLFDILQELLGNHHTLFRDFCFHISSLWLKI